MSKPKSRRIGHKIAVLLFIFITLATVTFIGLIASVTLDQYQDTKDWQKTTLTNELKDIPPFLARNYVRAEDKDAVQAWNEVRDILTEIETAGGITDMAKCEKALKTSIEKQEAYGLTTGEIPLQNEQLSLYLTIEEELAAAYTVPNTEGLKEVTNKLYAITIKAPSPIHNVYMEQLKKVAEDYSHLAEFLQDILPKLGTKNGSVLTAYISVTPKDSDMVIEKIEEWELQKFPLVNEIYDILTGNAWTLVLRQNELARSYQTWKDAEAELTSVKKSQYYNVSGILTYQDAVNAGLSVVVKEKDGYTVNMDSPVAAITYQGNIVAQGQFIRYGTPVTVTLNEQYTEIPKPTEPDPVPVNPNNPSDGWSDNWDEEEEPENPSENLPDSSQEQPDKKPEEPIEPDWPSEPGWDNDW